MPTSHSSPRDVSSSSFGGLAGRRILDVDEHEDDDGDYQHCFTQQCNILFTITVIFLSVQLLVSMAVFCETFISVWCYLLLLMDEEWTPSRSKENGEGIWHKCWDMKQETPVEMDPTMAWHYGAGGYLWRKNTRGNGPSPYFALAPLHSCSISSLFSFEIVGISERQL